MTLLALGAMVVAAVVVGSVALPVAADQIVGGEHDEGARLAAATGAAMRQANDVGSSFGRLIPAHAAAAREGEGDDAVRHEVAAALQAMASVYAGQGDLVANELIAAIAALRDAWSPGYPQAAAEHRRLAYRIEHAEGAARRYFEAQTPPNSPGASGTPRNVPAPRPGTGRKCGCMPAGGIRPTGSGPRPTG